MELLCHSVKAPFKPAEDLCTLQLAPILGNQAVAVKRIIIESESRVRGPNLVWVGVLQKDGWGWRHLRIYKPATIPGDQRDWDRYRTPFSWVPPLPLPFHSGLDSGGIIGLCLSHSKAFS